MPFNASSANNNPADGDKKNVKIAIAWRADTESEFFTNFIKTFREIGVEVVVLEQVKPPYVQYDGTNVAPACLDSAGIGYLNNDFGRMIRTNTYVGSNAAEVLAGVDGVIFTGGEDISPSLYAVQQDWHHVDAEIDYNAARDVSDYLTMAYCLDYNIPMMGFCRGMQMLGVVSGATVIQDIPTWFARQGLPYKHRNEKPEGTDYRDYAPHPVALEPGSLLALFFGTTWLEGCPSWHHQALLETKGAPLSVTATTTTSGITMIEGIERTDKRCAIGMQFHPEAAVAKHLSMRVKDDYSANKTHWGLPFTPYERAIQLFKTFAHFCKSNRMQEAAHTIIHRELLKFADSLS